MQGQGQGIMMGCFFAGVLWASATIQAVEPARTNLLQDVVVIATKTEKNIMDVPASIQIIDAAELKARNVIAVDELFKTAVGADLQGSGFPGSATRLNLRGLTPGYQSERVLVLIDGRRVNDQYVGNPEFSLLPADGIERIEILRGPASALYGSNAEGGVINIITKRGTETPATTIKAAAGSYNTQHYQFSHGWKTGVFDYFVSGSHVQTDGYMNNSDGTDRDWRADNVFGNFGIALDKDSDLRFSLGDYEGAGTDENSEREVHKDYEMATYNLKWLDKPDARLLVRVYRNAQHDVFDWKFPGEGVYRMETLAGEIQQSFWATERQRATAGVEMRREAVDIDEISGPIKEHTDTTGAFLQDEIHLTDTLLATAGIRNDYNSDYADEWSPRVSLLWHASDDAEVFGSVNRAHRAPSLSDRFAKNFFNGMEFVGNPDLKPETLMAYEVGLRARPVKKLRADLAVFLNDTEDSFDFMMDPDGVLRNRNATRTRDYGVEAGVQYEVSDILSVFANYSYTDGKYEKFDANPAVEGNQLAYLAPNKAAAGVNFLCPFGTRHSIACRYVDSRYGDAQNSPENKMSDYMVVDWHLRRPVGDHVDLTLNVDNLFAEKYQEYPRLDQPGLTAMAGVEARF